MPVCHSSINHAYSIDTGKRISNAICDHNAASGARNSVICTFI
jgi:hypothetical protein